MRAAERRRAGSVTISNLVEALNEITGLLKFDGEEERRRHIDTPYFVALNVVAAGSNLVSPEVPAALIRLSIQKVVIVLPHQIPNIVDRVGRQTGVVVSNRYHRRKWRCQDGATRWIRKID